LEIQARIPPAFAAIHNFIHDHEDPIDIWPGNYEVLGNGPAWRAEIICAKSKWEQIASAMWRSYQALTQGVGLELLEFREAI